MALKIQYVGHRNSLYALEEKAFSIVNYIPDVTVNDTLSNSTPKGVLGGMVAAAKGDYLCGAADGKTSAPLGLFINNAAGNAYENTPAVASGKCPFVNAMGAVQVDVYETHTEDGKTKLTYAVGDALYASKNGFLTKEASAEGNNVHTQVIGIVSKAPSGLDPWLGVELRI